MELVLVSYVLIKWNMLIICFFKISDEYVGDVINYSHRMYYNLTLEHATGIAHAVHGNFSGHAIQEVLVSRGTSLELLRPDPYTGKLYTLHADETCGVVKSLTSFRLENATKGILWKLKKKNYL